MQPENHESIQAISPNLKGSFNIHRLGTGNNGEITSTVFENDRPDWKGIKQTLMESYKIYVLGEIPHTEVKN